MQDSDSGTVAVIDLGTHSCLLLAGRSVGGRLEVLEDRCEIPALGEGLAASGRLSDAAMERTLAVLGTFAERARAAGCTAPVAVGTAAMRRAANAGELVAAAADRHGLQLRVLPAEREAALAWRAAAGPGGDAATGVVDVGGGSTEVASRAGEVRCSVPVGAVVLAERLGDGATWEQLLGAAREAFERADVALDFGRGPTVAIGGTATNLASLTLGLEAFDHRRVEGAGVTTVGLHELGARLAAMGLQERLGLPVEAPRAAVLPAGLACLAAALELLGASELRVTARGLRHGLLSELLGL